MAKLSGMVRDFKGNLLNDADVQLKDEYFQILYETKTDEQGYYELSADDGLYPSLFICKDYSINYLEYWAWQVPLFEDINIDARIGGLELYAINAFKIQLGIPTLSIYFRPMSLKRFSKMETISTTVLMKESKILNIAPQIEADNLYVELNGANVRVVEINKVLEYGGVHEEVAQHLYGYLIQVDIENTVIKDQYNKINIIINDHGTGEYGEGTVFWKK